MTEAPPTDFLAFPPDSVAVVTGAASGIGRATARELHGAGVTVVGVDRDADGLDTVVRELGGAASGIVADTSDPDTIDELFGRVRVETGRVPAHLVNNAGPPSSEALTIEEGLAQTAGSMQRCVAAWLALDPPVGASVVNVASVAGAVSGGPPASLGVRREGAAANGWYPVGKAAIGGLTRFLAVSLAGRARVNAVAPGVVETPRIGDLAAGPYGEMIRDRTPVGRLARADEVAKAITFLLSPAASYVNGVTLVVDGGGTLTF